MASISRSVALYACWVEVNLREKNSTGWKAVSEVRFCRRTAPIARAEASVWTSHEVPGVGSKMWRTGASQSLVFKVVKAFSWAVPHEKGTLARVSGVSGAAIAEKLRIKRLKN